MRIATSTNYEMNIFFMIFDILSFLIPLPFEKREIPSNIFVFPEPFFPNKTLQWLEKFKL